MNQTLKTILVLCLFAGGAMLLAGCQACDQKAAPAEESEKAGGAQMVAYHCEDCAKNVSLAAGAPPPS